MGEFALGFRLDRMRVDGAGGGWIGHSVAELTAEIETYIERNNQDPKPFVWAASAEQILRKVSKCKIILETLH